MVVDLEVVGRGKSKSVSRRCGGPGTQKMKRLCLVKLSEYARVLAVSTRVCFCGPSFRLSHALPISADKTTVGDPDVVRAPAGMHRTTACDVMGLSRNRVPEKCKCLQLFIGHSLLIMMQSLTHNLSVRMAHCECRCDG